MVHQPIKMDTHVSGYGAAAKTAPGGSAAREPKTPSTRFVVALLLSFALLGLVVVQHPLLFGDQVIDVSAKTGGADPEEVNLPVSTKTAVKVSALSKLMHQLDRSSNCWLRDLGLSTSCHTTNDKAKAAVMLATGPSTGQFHIPNLEKQSDETQIRHEANKIETVLRRGTSQWPEKSKEDCRLSLEKGEAGLKEIILGIGKHTGLLDENPAFQQRVVEALLGSDFGEKANALFPEVEAAMAVKKSTPAVVLRATGKNDVADALRAAGKNDVADVQECLSRLIKERNKASADAGEIVGGDVSGCDKWGTCKVCKQATLPALQAGNIELKHYIGSSAAAAVYMVTHPDILPYLNERLGGEQHYGKMVNGIYQNGNCPLGIPQNIEPPCLERLLNRRVNETRAAVQNRTINYAQSEPEIIATCGGVELYVNILAAHQAEIDLQKFIKHTTLVTEYEEKNPSITDYTDGTCPLALGSSLITQMVLVR
jgi:hypothetical protein